jgi:hypothetical protein
MICTHTRSRNGRCRTLPILQPFLNIIPTVPVRLLHTRSIKAGNTEFTRPTHAATDLSQLCCKMFQHMVRNVSYECTTSRRCMLTDIFLKLEVLLTTLMSLLHRRCARVSRNTTTCEARFFFSSKRVVSLFVIKNCQTNAWAQKSEKYQTG